MRSHFRVGTKTTSVLENAYAFHTKTIDYWFYQVLDLWSKGAHVYCFTCFRHHVWKPLKAKGTLQWWCRISSTLEFALFSSRNPSMILRLDKKTSLKLRKSAYCKVVSGLRSQDSKKSLYSVKPHSKELRTNLSEHISRPLK